jgi:hypothetical protein
MRYAVALIVGGLAAPVCAQTSPAEVGQSFRTRCLSCHQPPDVNLALDRAWLDQIHRTA